MFYKRIKRGFTLLELMIVIAIIAVLTSIVVPSAPRMIKKARDAKVKEQVSALRTALSVYFGANTGTYPNSLEDLVPDYLTKLETDWNGANSSGKIEYDPQRGRVFLKPNKSGDALDSAGQSYSDY
jgi:prepilin-type N-terminal cleavage/methylation domain-containing protein